MFRIVIPIEEITYLTIEVDSIKIINNHYCECTIHTLANGIQTTKTVKIPRIMVSQKIDGRWVYV